MKKIKLLLKVFLASLLVFVFVVVLYSASKRQCYHFVENLNYNCNGIGDLTNYIDYNMLSKDLKELIAKDDFKFSNTEEKYQFCNLIKDLDYEYKGKPNNVYSTNQLGRNDLAQRITIDGKRYLISVSIVFKPSLFFKPQIVDLDASIIDITISD